VVCLTGLQLIDIACLYFPGIDQGDGM